MTSLYAIGDSHIGCIVRAARKAGVRCAVGPCMEGASWAGGLFRFKDGVLRIYGEDLALTKTMEVVHSVDLREVEGAIVTTIGFHTLHAIRSNVGTLDLQPPFFLSKAVVQECANAMLARKHFNVLQQMASMGKTVIAFPPPPRYLAHLRLVAQNYENFIFDHFRQAGIFVIDPREFSLDEKGEFRSEYLPPRKEDLHHGNLAYGGAMLERILAILAHEEQGVAGKENIPEISHSL
jgi:hypothetical protein